MRFLAAIALVLCVSAAAPADEPLRHVRLDTLDAAALSLELERAGFDVLMGSVTDTSLEIIGSVSEIDRLKSLGYEPTLLAVGRPFRDIQAERLAIGDDLPPGYGDLDAIYAEMSAAATAYPNICQMVDITALYGQPSTYEGRHLYAVRISDNVAQEEDEPAVLVVSCHHAREIVTPVIALHAIEQLTTLYGSNPQITAAVDDNEIWIAPVWNPDGYYHVYQVDNMWRKNRRVFPTGIGVDQNRNYPINWDSACSGSTDPDSETYRGPSAGSEAETQTLIVWSQDQRFAKVIDFHSYGREALHGYACPAHPWDTFLQQEAAALSSACGYGGSIRMPSGDGEQYQWQMALLGGHANLVETHTSFQPAYSSAVSEAAQVWGGILWKIEHPLLLWGHVTDGVTGAPVAATIRFEGVGFACDEMHGSDPLHGRYHAFPPPGTYDLTFEAVGYDPITVSNVVVSAGTATQLDVAMAPPPQIIYPDGGESLTLNAPTTITWTGDPALRFHVQATYNHGDIGAITEGFESGVLDPAFETGGAAPWYVTYSHPLLGQHSVRAGDITHGQTSWMTRMVGGGNVSFWYYVSSEQNGDYFNFYVDGARQVHASGPTGWLAYSTSLPEGPHELKWEYAKNAGINGGEDSVWVDYMQIVADQTVWTDVVALSDVGAMSAPWTPTQLSDNCKVRIRAYYESEGIYGAWGESDGVFSVVEDPVGCSGDSNCDGAVNWRDIDYFVAAMNDNVAAWEALFAPGTPDCSFANNDVSGDGTVNWRDIDPLVAIMNTTCP